MLLFLPLGLFDISQAYLLWQVSNLLLCVACIYGLWRLFLKDYGVLSLLLVAVLLLGYANTFYVSFCSNQFLALLFFLLFCGIDQESGVAFGWHYAWLLTLYGTSLYLSITHQELEGAAIAILTLLTLTFLSILVLDQMSL